MLAYAGGRRSWINHKWTLCLLVVLGLLNTEQLRASEIRLRRQWTARVDGHTIHCAFAGGMSFAKPAFADLDGDGDLDLLVGGENGHLRFFVNRGTSQDAQWDFASDWYDSAMGTRCCPALADIDDDGDLDLLAGNREGRIAYFQNNGGSAALSFIKITDFYESIDVGADAAPSFVDIDGDSDLDLFLGRSDGRLSFYRNLGTRLTPVWSLVTDYYDSIDVGANSIPFFADMDADGDFDLFLGEDQGNVNFFRNVGSDTLADWELVSTEYNSISSSRRSAPAFADIDQDGDLDLLIGNDEGKLPFYENDGSPHLPSWTPVTDNYVFLDLGAYSAPALADIDADGDDDLFFGEESGKIKFYRTENAFPLPEWLRVADSYFAIEADDYSSPEFGDVDADGDLDLLVGRKDGRIEFYRNLGTPQSAIWNFEADQLDFVEVSGYASPCLGDIDGDADLDLLVGQTYGRIFFYRNDGTPDLPYWVLVTGTFESIDVGWYSSPALGDLDLDGDLDLLIGNNDGLSLYLNQGGTPQSSFQLLTTYRDSLGWTGRHVPALCDFDSDGDLDLFVGESGGGLCHYRNLILNSIQGKVTDGVDPLTGEMVILSGDRNDSTFTDSAGSYRFSGLPVGNYCVFRDPSSDRYCFSPLESDTFGVDFWDATSVGQSGEPQSPPPAQLHPNYPNPFNPLTHITYSLPSNQQVKLTVYNLKGEKVKNLVDALQDRGPKTVTWDGTDFLGRKAASGVYFCRLDTDLGSQVIRMVLLK
jgi:hypothetical protein